LVEYADALHATRTPFGLSLHEAYVRLGGLPSIELEPLTHSQLSDLDADTMREARDYLAQWVELKAPSWNQVVWWGWGPVYLGLDVVPPLKVRSNARAERRVVCAGSRKQGYKLELL
jgi:hypothetical protein